MNDFIVRCCQSLEAVAALEERWNELHQHCSNPSVYNTFDFIYASVCAFPGKDYLLKIFTIEDTRTKSLLAIFPWQRHRGSWYFIPVNEYGYTAREEIDKPYPVIDADNIKLCWRLMLDHLQKSESGWDVLTLIEMPEDCVDRRILPAICDATDLHYKEIDGKAGPILYFDQDWDTYWAQHKKMRKKVNKMEKDFGDRLQFNVYCENRLEHLEQYQALEQKSWKKGKVGISKNYGTRSFYESLMKRFNDGVAVYFGFLTIDGELVSAEIAYGHRGTLYFSHGCYDNHYQKYSPGMVSTSLFIKYFYDKDYQAGDFLCGYAGYLNAWSDKVIKTKTIEIYSNNRKMAVVAYAQHLKRHLKNWFDKQFNRDTVSG